MSKNLPNEFTYNNLDPKNQKISLLKQELDVNIEEQGVVNQRLNLLKETLEKFPNTDPQYAILFTQKEMDQIQLDELIKRQEEIEDIIRSL